MRAILTNLTASLLFIHSVFGCCWHHAHDCDHCVAKTQQSTGLAFGCCGNDHADQGQPAERRPCRFECQGLCTYLPPEKTTVEASTTATAPFELLVVHPNLVASNARASSRWQQPHESPTLAGSLRLHLWHRILLI